VHVAKACPALSTIDAIGSYRVKEFGGTPCYLVSGPCQ
jgi:hypothetical protein